MWNLRLESLHAHGRFVLLLVLAFLVGFSCVAFKIERVESLDYVYIYANGSIDPPSAPISTFDNITYVFNASIGGLVVERDNIIIDGAGCTIQGRGPGPCGWSGTGVDLDGRENVTVKNLEINGFMFGVDVTNGSDCAICQSLITNNYRGIEMVRSSNTTICGNNVTADEHGIHLCISFESNTIFGNYIADNSYSGIWLDGSSNQILYENVIDNNPFCFDISGSEPSHFVHSIDASNLVNGKPVYYLVNQTDLVLTNVTHPQVGYLALANCTNITVDGLSLADSGPLLLLAYTSNSTIVNNTITNSTAHYWYGVLLEASYNNTFAGNNITKNDVGIWLKNSSCNIFSANNIRDNFGGVLLRSSSANNTFVGNNIASNEAGIEFEGSCNNTLAGNNITENGCGITLYASFNNSFYHNNFIDNVEHVRLSSSSWPNFWDDGYPSGGNYWSGYSDTDQFSGPYQNETGSDGIWDHPYVINTENQDNYPTVPEHQTPMMLLIPMIFASIIIAVHRREKRRMIQ